MDTVSASCAWSQLKVFALLQKCQFSAVTHSKTGDSACVPMLCSSYCSTLLMCASPKLFTAMSYSASCNKQSLGTSRNASSDATTYPRGPIKGQSWRFTRARGVPSSSTISRGKEGTVHNMHRYIHMRQTCQQCFGAPVHAAVRPVPQLQAAQDSRHMTRPCIYLLIALTNRASACLVLYSCT